MNTFNLSGATYRKSTHGDRTFIEFLGDSVEVQREKTNTPKPVVRRRYEIGEINGYNEMKVAKTGDIKQDWVYVGRLGKEHPKVKHLFE